jgi:hypothetical protein
MSPVSAVNKMVDLLAFADSLTFRLKFGREHSWEAWFFSI